MGGHFDGGAMAGQARYETHYGCAMEPQARRGLDVSDLGDEITDGKRYARWG